MTGRTHKKYMRVYGGGYDLSGYTRNIGPLVEEFDMEETAALSDPIMTGMMGKPSLRLGTLDGLLNNTAVSGLHALHSVPGSLNVWSVVIGAGAVPVAGDPAFSGSWRSNSYYVPPEATGAIPASIEFGEYAYDAVVRAYDRAFGRLLHANGAETAANNGTADHDNGASSAGGGFGFLHVLSGNGTATFSIEHSATNTDAQFDATGAIITFATTAAATPFGEVKAAASITTTVQRYLRWQVTLGTATTVTFVMGFVRGR